jgi:hypothetical protein
MSYSKPLFSIPRVSDRKGVSLKEILDVRGDLIFPLENNGLEMFKALIHS